MSAPRRWSASCLQAKFILIFLAFFPYTLGNILKSKLVDASKFHTSRDTAGISFTIPDNVAVSVKNFVTGDNTCPITGSIPSFKDKRIPDDFVTCLVEDAEDIIDALSPGGPLASLLNELQAGTIALPADPVTFIDESTNQALSYVLAYASNRIPTDRPGISSSDIQNAGQMAFYIVYSFVFRMAIDTLANIIVQSAVLTAPAQNHCIDGLKPICDTPLCEGKNGICSVNYFTGCPCDDKACPLPEEDSLRCSLDCGGADSSGKCLGDAEGNYKGCDCVPVWDVPLYNATEHNWEDITGVIAALPDLVFTATTTCNPTTSDTWTYGPAAELAVKLFCASSTNLSGQSGDIHKEQYGVGTEDDIIVKVILNDPTSPNVDISQDICFSTMWNILNCPRSGTNVYGGTSQMPNNGSTFSIVPNGGVPTLQCDPVDPPYLAGSPTSYKVALNRDGMTAAYNDFCDQYGGTKVKDGVLQVVNGPFGGAPVPNHQNIRTLVQPMFWLGGPPEGCASWDGIMQTETCKLVFGMLTDKCDPTTNVGKRGGQTNFECIQWHMDGYTSTADMYHLHIHQQMVDSFSQVEWTLSDSRGTVVGGPSTDGTVTGAPQNLGFHIDSPTNKDKTNVRMFYPAGGKFQFSTGWTGSSGSSSYRKEYYCDDILDGGPGSWTAWESNGRNGFERQFDCFFRGWGNNDGDVI